MNLLKNELKAKAAEIRKTRVELKELQRSGQIAGHHQYSLISLKRDYRHRHIAYSMLRGRSYEQIEPKCREDHKPNMDLVKEIMDEYAKENVCVGA